MNEIVCNTLKKGERIGKVKYPLVAGRADDSKEVGSNSQLKFFPPSWS
jgi:hypothetical protein